MSCQLDVELHRQGRHLRHDTRHVVDAIDNLDEIVAKLEQLRAVLVDAAGSPVRAHLRGSGEPVSVEPATPTHAWADDTLPRTSVLSGSSGGGDTQTAGVKNRWIRGHCTMRKGSEGGSSRAVYAAGLCLREDDDGEIISRQLATLHSFAMNSVGTSA
jgi:hypothetical protein